MPGDPAATTYEQWVRTVHAWSVDESVSLAGLPALTEDSLPAAAYDRLITHLNESLEKVADTWARSLTKVAESIGAPSDLAVDLVALRRKLARRLELARHPGLPEVLRRAYSGAVDRSVRQAQQQLEDAIKELGRSGRTPSALVDELYRVVRGELFRHSPGVHRRHPRWQVHRQPPPRRPHPGCAVGSRPAANPSDHPLARESELSCPIAVNPWFGWSAA